MTFNVTVNTKENKELNLDELLHGRKEDEKPANETKEETEETPFVFDDISKESRCFYINFITQTYKYKKWKM